MGHHKTLSAGMQKIWIESTLQKMFVSRPVIVVNSRVIRDGLFQQNG